MNKLSTLLTLATICAAALTGCQQAPKGDEASIADKETAASQSGVQFVVDTAESKIRFTGHGVGKNHPGNFRLSEGKVSVNGEQISGGEFTIDIASLDVEQREEMFQTKLKPHLLSGDFFDAEKFGTARFEITRVEPYEHQDGDSSIVDGANFRVSGNLTLKDVTKNVTFPARIDLDNDKLKAEANFDIDRREWQMNYGNDKTLGDKFISETVNIELDLEAKRAENI